MSNLLHRKTASQLNQPLQVYPWHILAGSASGMEGSMTISMMVLLY
jgi:hypothetical protein